MVAVSQAFIGFARFVPVVALRNVTLSLWDICIVCSQKGISNIRTIEV